MLNVSTTLALLAMLASLAVAAPAAAAPDAPAQEEYILELPSAGNGSGDVGDRDRTGDGAARSRTPETLSTLTANAGDDGSVVLVIVLAATALVGVLVAIVKAVK